MKNKKLEFKDIESFLESLDLVFNEDSDSVSNEVRQKMYQVFNSWRDISVGSMLCDIAEHRMLIIGSRSITDFDLSPYIPRDVDLIITGGATGIDTLAEKYADEHKISKIVLRPKYAHYKKGAPLKRNIDMVNLADSVLAIWDGESAGTIITVKYAEQRNRDITLINMKNTE